jgi:AcrR family transcriptional regulator
MPKDTFINLPDEKRERIMDIALEEFSENAYDSASISKIVKKADIAKGSFYQYFESKKHFYQYLIELSSEEKINILKQLPAPNPTSDLFGYMRWQFQAAVYFELHRPKMARILYRAFIEEIPFPEMTEELRRRGTTQFFKQLLTQGILHGDIAPWVDPDVAAFITEVVFYQFGKYFIERLNLIEADFYDQGIFTRQDAQDLVSNLMDILEGGMRRDPDQRDNFLNQV